MGVRPWRGGEQCQKVMGDALRGRASCGVVDIVGGVLLVSFYGISGLKALAQLPCWVGLATLARAAGLPTIFTGDWQVEPAELLASGFVDLVGGVVFATDEPTNVQSGKVLDYFVVSRELEPLVVDVQAVVGSRLATHLPVVLRLKGARSLGSIRRVSQPKLHGAFLPQGPMPAGIAVDWNRWGYDDHGGAVIVPTDGEQNSRDNNSVSGEADRDELYEAPPAAATQDALARGHRSGLEQMGL